MSRSNWLSTEAVRHRLTQTLRAAGLGLGMAALGMTPARAMLGFTPKDALAHAAASNADPSTQTLWPMLLAVSLNGIAQDEAITVLQGPGVFAIPAQVWNTMHLRAPNDPPILLDGQEFHSLNGMPGLHWRIDESSQTLMINAPATVFAGARMDFDAPTPITHATLPRGGYVNYDLQWQRNANSGSSRIGQAWRSGLIEIGGFSSYGTGRFTGLVRNDSMDTTALRLDSTWTVDVPDKLASLRLGDSISRAGAWGRAVRFAGVQWSTDFSLQPGFLSFPLPSMRGEAALPSTVDVYVNNSHRLQSQIPAGPFDLTDLPIVTGQGQVRMVVRDLLGREQVIVQPYYVSPSLLRSGLRSFSYELGRVREDYGLESNHYGRVIGSVTDRLGVTDSFTREYHAEAAPGQLTAGATGLWLIPSFGRTSLSLAGSRSSPGAGVMLSAGGERQNNAVSSSLQLSYNSRNFRQIGQQSDAGSPRISASGSFGGSWRGLGLGAGYVFQTTWDGERTRIASLNASRNLGSFGAIGFFFLRDLDRSSTTVAVSLTQVLDARTSAQATHTRTRDGANTSTLNSLSVQRSLPAGEGFGYQLSADRGDLQRSSAQGVWQTDKASFSAGLAHTADSNDVRLGVSGGVAWMSNSMFLSRRIEGSYAVVEVDDYPDVQVLHDNRPVARTDQHGRAFISGLRGYEPNLISINLGDLPFDAEVERQDAVLTPAAHSGTSLRIAVTRTLAASFRLVLPSGQPVPPGSDVTVAGQTREFPVGFDGKAFVSGLGMRTRVHARWQGGECGATLTLKADMDEVPELGPVLCQ